MATINPYLNFNGKAEEAFNFYRSVFGGEFTSLQRFRDTPEAGKVAEADLEKIIHISLPIGGNILMASDVPESYGRKIEQATNMYISYQADSIEDARRIFKELSAGGTVEMELQETFWGALFGSLRDKYGINWMVDYELKKE